MSICTRIRLWPLGYAASQGMPRRVPGNLCGSKCFWKVLEITIHALACRGLQDEMGGAATAGAQAEHCSHDLSRHERRVSHVLTMATDS